MSTATTSPNITHLPHTPHAPHPIPLREQAFALHCQGLRSPAIAAELGVPERTIRAWIAAALAELKDDLQLSRHEQLLLAVERQHQLTATAWQQFEHEAAARDTLLDAALETLLNGATTEASHASARSVSVHLPASTPAPRYLSLILAANKETNRLLGLHTLARLHILNPDTPETNPADSDIPAESATATFDLQYPAESATASDGLAAGLQPANPHPTIPLPSLALGASPATLAQSATASGSPLPAGAARAFVGASGGRPRDDAGAERAERAAGKFRPKPVAGGDPSKVVGEGWIGSGVESPAKTATASAMPADLVGASGGRPPRSTQAVSQSRIPAESATASSSHRPATTSTRRAYVKPQPWMM